MYPLENLSALLIGAGIEACNTFLDSIHATPSEGSRGSKKMLLSVHQHGAVRGSEC
jgi:hypothetical protein